MQKDLPTGCIKFLVMNFNTSSRKITGIENSNTAFHSAQFNGVTRKMAYINIKIILVMLTNSFQEILCDIIMKDNPAELSVIIS